MNSPHFTSLQSTSKQDYTAAIRKHTASWWRRPASEISKLDVRELFAQMKANGLSVSHIKKMKLLINKIFIFGMDKKLIRGIDQSPSFGISLHREEEKKPKILTIHEIRKLLDAARTLNHPWYPVWTVALLTGMRSGELYALLWSDIDWDNCAISVNKSYNCRFNVTKCTMSGHWRSVPMSKELRNFLFDLKKSVGTRPTVLPKIRNWTLGFQAEELRKFCVGLNLPSVKFHTLRACFATQLIRNGIPPIQIQKICGWTDLKTMQRYIRLAGIEITGATEGLNVISEMEVMNQATAFLDHG